MITTPTKDYFNPLILQDEIHPDRAAIDSFVKRSALIVGVPIRPNEDYKCIQDKIYEILNLVSNEKVAEDNKALHKAP